MEIGININGDISPKNIVEGSKTAEASGYDFIWIGEAIKYMHPLPIMALVSQETENITVGTGIISPQLNQCHHIMTAFQNLQDVYGNRFAIGIAPGDIRGLKITGALTKHPLQKVKNCIREVRKKFADSSTLPIYIGASGPKMVEVASKKADGVLLNYVYPEFISWALRYFKDGPCRKAAYGPTLLKPDETNIELLRVSAAIVLSGGNKTFLREFGLEETALEVNSILYKRQFHKLRMYDDLLLSKFAIYGSLREVEERVDELKHLGICQVVFATPLCRNVASIKKIGDAFS